MDKIKAFETVKKALLEIDPAIDGNVITLSASLKDDLGLDSLDVVELTMVIEDTFKFPSEEDKFTKAVEKLTDDKLIKDLTVQHIVTIVESI